MSGKKVKFQLIAQEEMNGVDGWRPFISISEEIQIDFLPSNGQRKATSCSPEAHKLWIGMGATETEAMCEYFKARLGRGYSWDAADAVLRGDWLIGDFAFNFGLSAEEAQVIIQELWADRLEKDRMKRINDLY